MVGKIPRKRESCEFEPCTLGDQIAMDDCDILGDLGHKRLRLDTDMSGDDELPGYSMLSPHDFGASDPNDLMHDSGSDCVPMVESPSLDAAEEGDEEPYIDVVSEDSAIQEEDPLDDFTSSCPTTEDEPVPYSHHHITISPMDNLMTSTASHNTHDDSAIIKSEIFESAYDHDMNQVLSSAVGVVGGDPYDHHSAFSALDFTHVPTDPGLPPNMLEGDDEDDDVNVMSQHSLTRHFDALCGGGGHGTDDLSDEKSSLESLSPNSAHSALSSGSGCEAIGGITTGSSVAMPETFIPSSKPSSTSPINETILPQNIMPPNINLAAAMTNGPVTLAAGSATISPQSYMTSLTSSPNLTLNNPSSNNTTVASPVLTTPVYFAQGVPGPAGQTNSIITTHMARLVPSPDGKGYILHLGLNPPAGGATATNPGAAVATGAVSANLTNSTIPPPLSNTSLAAPVVVSPQLTSQVAMGTTQLANGGVGATTAQLTGTVSMNGLNPASLNITITPATATATQQESAGAVSSAAAAGTIVDVPTPIPADVASSSSSPLGGSTLETDPEGNIMLINNANNGAPRAGSEVMNVGDPVGTRVDSASYLNVINQGGSHLSNINITGSAINPAATTGTTNFETLMTSFNSSNSSVTASESLLASTQSSLVTDTLSLNTKQLLENATPSEQQLLRLMTPVAQVQQATTAPVSATTTSTVPTTTHKTKSSKRRNSRELRELVELEKISSSASKNGDDLDRFVICSDGPMNCALCGYNTGSYSSFKSHIICSHPCWRITKKLSRNRLLVEKSVKVSIPVANFSVPNPVPAVPIQPRVQSGKKGGGGSGGSKKGGGGDKASSGDKGSDALSGSSNGGKDSETSTTTSKSTKHSRHKGDKSSSNSSNSSSSSRQSNSSSRSSSSSQSRTQNSSHSKSSRSSSMKTQSSSTGESASSSGTTTCSLRSVKRSLSDGDLSCDNVASMDTSSTSTSSHVTPDAANGLTGRERQIIERNKRIFRCTKCMRLFVFEGSVVNHIIDQHGLKKAYDHLQVSNDHGNTFGPMFRCPNGNCCFTSGSTHDLERHKAEKHAPPMQKVYRCQICGFSAESTKAVKEHAARIHPQKDMMYGLTD